MPMSPHSPPDFPSRWRAFLAARLSPEGAAGAHLTMGLVALLLAMTAFGIVADEVVTGARLTVLDVTVANWFHARATPALTQLMLAISYLHGPVGGLVLSVLLLGYFLRRKMRWWALAGSVILPGGMLLNVLIKYCFQRARPTFDVPLLTLTTYSFPSGHTAFAAMFYGLLACSLLPHPRPAGRRVAADLGVALAACCMVALVGLSRMVLGVHYLSDVLAASAEGVAWLAICITAVSTLRRRREGRALV